MNHKTILESTGVSLRSLADTLNLSPSVVSQVLNGKYTGSESTAKKVTDYIEIFSSKNWENLNPVLYAKSGLCEKIFLDAVKSRKYDLDETETIISILKIFKKYNESSKEKSGS